MSAHCFRDVNVLDESGSFTGPLDVLVEDGRIAKIGKALAARDVESSDFAGLWLMPGVFDCHDHVTMSTVSAEELLARQSGNRDKPRILDAFNEPIDN